MKYNKDTYKSLKNEYISLKKLYTEIQTENKIFERERVDMRRKLEQLEEEVKGLRLQKKNFDITLALKDEKQHENFLKYLEGSDAVDRLKNISNVSNKIRLDMLQNILKISNENKKYFDIKIFEWANQFGFRIEGDYLTFDTGAMLEFIKMLEEKFEEWQRTEKPDFKK